MTALAAVAVGMFVGTWVIGPAVTHDTDTPPQAQERTTFDAMLARPDPSPYRAATPAFDNSGPPNYAAAAKAKAQAELGGETADDEAPPEPPSAHASSRYYPKFDRHKVY